MSRVITKEFMIKVLFVSIMICVIDLFVRIQNNDLDIGGNLFVMYMGFYDANVRLIHVLFLMGAFPIVVTYDSFLQEEKRLDDYMIMRIGYKRYFKNEMIKVIIRSLVFGFFVSVAIFVYLYMLHAKPGFISEALYFTKNPVMNFVIFNFFRFIGFVILGLLTYAYCGLIKNKYIFLVMPVAFIFISLFIALSFTGVLMGIADNDIMRVIGLSFMIHGLIAPGTIIYRYGMINGPLCCTIFLALSIGIFLWKKQRKRRYG